MTATRLFDQHRASMLREFDDLFRQKRHLERELCELEKQHSQMARAVRLHTIHLRLWGRLIDGMDPSEHLRQSCRVARLMQRVTGKQQERHS